MGRAAYWVHRKEKEAASGRSKGDWGGTAGEGKDKGSSRLVEERSSRTEACREEDPAAAAEGGREEAVSGSSLRWEEDPVGRSSIPDLG